MFPGRMSGRAAQATEQAGRAVSEENVEVVRQSLDAFSRRDVNALRGVNDPDLELDWSRSVGWLAGVYLGFDAALRFYEGYFQAFQQVVIKPDRFIDIGEFVVVPNVAHQLGRDGIEVSARSTPVFQVRDGKIIRICLYQETEDALNALRLSE
jgi:ketosteroid isomerase-like protein